MAIAFAILNHVSSPGRELRRNFIYVSIAVVALVLSYGLLFLGPSAADTYSSKNDDSIVEWLGALALLATSVLFFFAFLQSRGKSDYGRVKRFVLLLLAVAFLFGAGEEISWGRRIFGIDSPVPQSEAGRGREDALHNLDAIKGPSIGRWFQFFWVVFGVLIPTAAALFATVRRRLGTYLPIFPIWVALLLVGQQAIAELTEILVAGKADLYHGSAVFSGVRFEVTETVVSLIFAAGAAAIFTRVRNPPE